MENGKLVRSLVPHAPVNRVRTTNDGSVARVRIRMLSLKSGPPVREEHPRIIHLPLSIVN